MATSRAADSAPGIPDDMIWGRVTVSRALGFDHVRLNLLDLTEKFLLRKEALIDKELDKGLHVNFVGHDQLFEADQFVVTESFCHWISYQIEG